MDKFFEVINGVYLNGTYGSWGLNNIMESNIYCETTATEDNIPLSEDLEVIVTENHININSYDFEGSIILYDLAGRVLCRTNFSPGSSTIPIQGFSNGMYLLSVMDKNIQVRQYKIIKR